MTSKVRIDFEARGTTLVKREIDSVGNAAEDAGDDFQSMARDAGFLDKRIGELRGEVKGLIAEFSKTGDMDLIKKINAGNRQLGQFDRLKKQFADLSGEMVEQATDVGVKVGVKLGGGIMSSAASTLSGSKAMLIGSLVGLGVAASPFLGAAISSAVLGAAGAGGIVGGVALAAKDARVQDEAKKLGEHISKAFQSAGEPFIAPTIKALQELHGVTDKVSADLRKGFETIAPVFLPLVRGISGLVEQAMPGFLKALEEAKPIIRAIANELPDIGRSISDFFRVVSSEGDGAIQGFIVLSKIIQGAIRGTGMFLAALSATYEGIVRFAAKTAPILEALYGWIPGVGDIIASGRKRIEEAMAGLAGAKDASGDFAGSLKDVADSATEAKNKLLALNSALERFFGIAMNSSQATIAYERAWDDMIDQLKKGKRTLDVTTEAGRENLESINDTIQGIQGMHQARVDEGMAIQDSLAIRDRDLEALRKQLLQLGYNKQQIDDIINLYKLMPELASTSVEAPGADTTIAQLRELLSLINAIKGGVALGALGGVKVGGKRAAGGPVLPGQTYLVGEQGPELLTMGSANGNVTNATKTAAMMSGTSGGAAYSFNVTPQYTGMPLMDVLMAALAERLRITGGRVGEFRVPRAA